MTRRPPPAADSPCTVHHLSVSNLALVGLRLALDAEGWAPEGRRLLYSARAIELLRHLPDPATDEPQPPAPIGRDASTEQAVAWHAQQRAWQAKHDAWARAEREVELTDHQRDLCREAISHEATARAVQARLGSRALGALALALGFGPGA